MSLLLRLIFRIYIGYRSFNGLCQSSLKILKKIDTIEIENIIQAITSLDFSNVNYSQKSDISAPNVIFLTLAQIWKAHYRYIFDDTPFQFTPIMGLIRENI
jgi:hypothetical protein